MEEFVAGTEVECGVLGNPGGPGAGVASSSSARLPGIAEWYDYAAKYDEGGSDIITPPGSTTRRQRVFRRSRSICSSRPSARGWARVDFFVREGGGVAANEINHDPGLHLDQYSARLFEVSGIPWPASCSTSRSSFALERHERRAGPGVLARLHLADVRGLTSSVIQTRPAGASRPWRPCSTRTCLLAPHGPAGPRVAARLDLGREPRRSRS